MQPHSFLSEFLVFVFQGVPASPFRLRRRLGPRPASMGVEAMEKAERGGPLLSSPSRGRGVLREANGLGPKLSSRRTADHIRLLVLHHVPEDRRQPTHHRHPRNL
jgi:hypothetical protein